MPTVWLLRLLFAFNSETLFFTFITLWFFCDFQIILKICALHENAQFKNVAHYIQCMNIG